VLYVLPASKVDKEEHMPFVQHNYTDYKFCKHAQPVNNCCTCCSPEDCVHRPHEPHRHHHHVFVIHACVVVTSVLMVRVMLGASTAVAGAAAAD
jgi:hypothetical protein